MSGWGDLLKKYEVEKGSWKCGACLVTNKPGTHSCVSCESENPDNPRPVTANAVGDPFAASADRKRKADSLAEAPASKKAATNASISGSGFVFNAPTTSTSAGGGFSFGGATSTTATTATGFTFGGGASSVSTTASAGSAGGFTFGGTAASTTSAGGFTFGAPSTSESKVEDEESVDDTDFDGASIIALASASSAHGAVATVGCGDCGQLGLGEDEDVELTEARRVPALAGKQVTGISAGGLHNAVIIRNGDLYTWGCNDDCALGRGGDEWLPAKVEGVSKVVQVVCSDTHSAALTASGEVFSWGTYKDANGYLGYSTDVQKQAQPMRVDFGAKGKKIVMIACGVQHTVALSSEGKIFCWGSGEQGQLARKVITGRKNTQLEARCMTLPGRGADRRAVAVYAGGYCTFAVAASGRVYAWGLNNFGQLGVGDNVDRRSATPMPPLEDDQRVVQVSGGEHHTLLLTNLGKVYAVGRSDSGQLGIGGAQDTKKKGCETSAVRVPGLRRVVRVSAGGAHSVAVTDQGAVYTWGYGEMAQLGNGRDDRDERSPFKVSAGVVAENGAKGVVMADGGGQHTLFLVKGTFGPCVASKKRKDSSGGSDDGDDAE